MPFGTQAYALTKYMGSKSYQLKYLYEIFSWAKCSHFIDGCAGMGSVSLNIPANTFKSITVNDKDSYIYNVWEHFSDDTLFAQLKEKLLKTKHTLETYWEARNIYCRGYKSFSKLDIAWATVVSHRMSRSAVPCMVYQKSGRLRGGQNECVNAWEGYLGKLDKLHELVKPLDLMSEDILDILEVTQDTNTLIYIDPPYPFDTRACKMYRTEMADKKHQKMLKLCRESSAKIVISGRPNSTYEYMLHDWHMDIRQINNNMDGKTKAKRAKKPEVVWSNFEWVK